MTCDNVTSYDLIELRYVMRCGGILKTTEAVCGVDGVVCEGRTENWITSVVSIVA